MIEARGILFLALVISPISFAASSRWWGVAPSTCPAVRMLDRHSTNGTVAPTFVKYAEMMRGDPILPEEQALLARMKLTAHSDPAHYDAENPGADFSAWRAEVDVYFDGHRENPEVRNLVHRFIVRYAENPPAAGFPGALNQGAHPVKTWREFFAIDIDPSGQAGFKGDPLVKHIWYNLKGNMDLAEMLSATGNFNARRDKDRVVGDRPYTKRDAALETETVLRRTYLRLKIIDEARREYLAD